PVGGWLVARESPAARFLATFAATSVRRRPPSYFRSPGHGKQFFRSPVRHPGESAPRGRRDALRRELARVALRPAARERGEHDANGFARRVGPAERAG